MSEMSNPYQPPSSRVAERRFESRKPVSAERWRRFVNCLIDGIGLYVINLVIVITIGLVGGIDTIKGMQGPPQFFLSLLIGLSYYIVLEASFGWTLGKLVTGTRVVNEKGVRPTVSQILGRTFARYIPFEPFSFFRDGASGLHDSLSHTLVVRNR